MGSNFGGVNHSVQGSIVTDSDSTSGSLHTLHESSVGSGAQLSQLIYPFSPTLTRRYRLNRTVDDEPPKRNINPLSLSFKNEEQLPQGWQRHVHPEGLPYFCSPVSDTCPMRILTEEWLFDSDKARAIENFLQDIQNTISQYNVLIPAMSDLVLELFCGEGPWMCGYYFVNHPTRSIYWLEEVELEHQSEPFNEIRGKISGHQIETCLEVEYWVYWDTFPTVQIATPDVYDYVVDTLVSAMTDVISSNATTITRTHETLQNMLNVVQMSKGSKTSNWHIGRFMREIVLDRLRNYYGVWGARLHRHQAVLKHPASGRSKFLGWFSPFLFFIPHAQLQRVEPLVVDRSVIAIHWDKFFGELQEEWNQTMTVATIMLAANCAFLAIPMFQSSGTAPDQHSTPEQVASYLSLVSSLFGLILSIVMYRQHQADRPSTPAEILSHIYNNTTTKSGPRHRLEHLVLIWSLPHALVLWSVVTFLVAFLIMCFSGTSNAAKIIVALSTGLLGSLVFYYVLRFGSGKKFRRQWSDRSSRYFEDIRGLIRGAKQGLKHKLRKGDSETITA
ncbi:hypothetical protein P691DRAFT_758189 [Macrolepiota fuliginosa MF-IS2]|uniref:Uncharacterized protein n=1 Tax=Macrolepiota fuliginosa MF-IS2 TaxID=1400762 RepID=A0A9P5XG99_9AGAR|nr:hypothetical protein P691DRAFT_758189 [Macrolepiota fuliginosa MF-IS2]